MCAQLDSVRHIELNAGDEMADQTVCHMMAGTCSRPRP